MRTRIAAALFALSAGLSVAMAPAAEKSKDAPKGPVTVIHVGDSFVASGFAQALKPKFAALGAKYIVNSQTSAYTTTLPRQVRLDSMLTVHKPVMVILTIGANEMAMPIPSQHAHAVKNLAKLASGTQCVFTIPPPWDDKETGILDILAKESAPCRVFDARPIASTIARGPDKMHPSPKGGETWANAFWTFLMDGRPDGQAPWEPKADSTQASRDGK
jgi:lysophospholipase L1-like esterase